MPRPDDLDAALLAALHHYELPIAGSHVALVGVDADRLAPALTALGVTAVTTTPAADLLPSAGLFPAEALQRICLVRLPMAEADSLVVLAAHLAGHGAELLVVVEPGPETAQPPPHLLRLLQAATSRATAFAPDGSPILALHIPSLRDQLAADGQRPAPVHLPERDREHDHRGRRVPPIPGGWRQRR